MKILLDENFPLALERHLKGQGFDVEHIILLGVRGVSDAAIRDRLRDEEILFLTQDTEFERVRRDWRGIVVLSRVDQGLPVDERVRLWSLAIPLLLKSVRRPGYFELGRDGSLRERAGPG